MAEIRECYCCGVSEKAGCTCTPYRCSACEMCGVDCHCDDDEEPQ